MPVTNSLRLRGEDFAGARDCAAGESHHQWAFSAAKRQAGARAEATGRRRLRRGELWRSEQNHPSLASCVAPPRKPRRWRLGEKPGRERKRGSREGRENEAGAEGARDSVAGGEKKQVRLLLSCTPGVNALFSVTPVNKGGVA